MSDLDVAALRRAAKSIGIGQEYCYVPKETLNTLLDDRERVTKLERVAEAAREVSAMDIDFLISDRKHAFAAADKLADAIAALDEGDHE
jgi:hypothetical protein